jgi:predicted ATP-grasp superfamily ATP-dependent carboligase
LGVSEQLVGTPWTGAAVFHYAGSMGPLPLREAESAALVELGDGLASAFGLQGLFGVDVLLAAEDIYAVDINPRFPASVEVLERASGFSAVELHVAGCRGEAPPVASQVGDGRFQGKAILFARRRCIVGEVFSRLCRAAWNRGGWPDVADVPAEGSVIEAGRPVMTVFARGESWGELEQGLRAAVAWRDLMGG